MNVVLFGLKRAFQASIRMTRPIIAAHGLTAARFDMLYLIKGPYRRLYDPGVKQSDLRRALGVTAPTVSRMLRSLEKLGLVTRARPSCGDTRQRIVNLTLAGLSCIRRAIRSIVRRRTVEIAFAKILTNDRSYSTHIAEIENAESVCRCIRAGFGDTATLHYPWHPDD